jgi:hypothetical protein
VPAHFFLLIRYAYPDLDVPGLLRARFLHRARCFEPREEARLARDDLLAGEKDAFVARALAGIEPYLASATAFSSA